MCKKNQNDPNIEEFLDSFNSYFSLPSGSVENCQISNESRNNKWFTIFDVTMKDPHPECPHCGNEVNSIHGYRDTLTVHNIMKNRNSEVRVHLRRYKCPACRRTFTEPNPFTTRRRRISHETIVSVLADLKKPQLSYTEIGRRHGLSATTVASIFDTHVERKRLPLSEFMCIDENYAFKEGNSKYICLLVDFKTGEAIDVLPNRFKSQLIHYFKSIPAEERVKVKAIGTDMYRTYKEVIEECFPKSTLVVVDRFHLVAEFGRQEDEVRLSVQRTFYKQLNDLKRQISRLKELPDFQSEHRQEEFRKLLAQRKVLDDSYYLLKHFSWLLFKDSTDKRFDINAPKQYNSHFKYEMNYYDIKKKLLSLDPTLEEADSLRSALTELYTFESPEEGTEYFDEMVDLFRTSSVQTMRHFGLTLKHWRKEILNSLTIVDQIYEVQKDGRVTIRNRRLHNGVIERRNRDIKNMKNLANGFSNFDRFRNRVLYCLREDPSFSLDPAYESKAIKGLKKGRNGSKE